MQHGTVLLNVDVDKMFAMLKSPMQKIKGKYVKTSKSKITSLEGKQDFNTVRNAVKSGFEDVFSAQFSETRLSKEEEELAKQLYNEKYNTKKWNRN